MASSPEAKPQPYEPAPFKAAGYTDVPFISFAPDGKSLAWVVACAGSELWILERLRTPRPWFQRLLGKHP